HVIRSSSNTLNDLFYKIYYYLFIFQYLLFKKNDIVHVHNGPYELIILKFIRIFKKIKFIYTYTFPFIDRLKEKNLDRNTALIRRLYYKHKIRLYEFGIRNSDIIFPISDYLGNKLIKDYGIDIAKILPVSESASKIFLDYSSNKKLDKGSKRIIYTGLLDQIRNPAFIIEVFERVQQQYNDVFLVLLGFTTKSKDFNYLMNLITRSKSASHIVLHSKVSYNEVPKYISECDIGISPIIPLDVYLVSTPTKLIEYMSIGIPVVANIEIPDQEHIINSSNGGILCKYEVIDFSNAILSVLNDDKLSHALGKNGLQWIKENRTFEIASSEIVNKLNKLLYS
ncbi:MAG: glycosyltransferase, partial [Saprospiraceae bacterium]|nr:glycosyltransferase [Saprospiraceae bacterium]